MRQEAPAEAAVTDASYDGVPSQPPPEVLRSLDAAAKTLADLADRRLELRIAADERSLDIQVDVRDARGDVVLRLPVSRAVEMLANGTGRGLLYDERA